MTPETLDAEAAATAAPLSVDSAISAMGKALAGGDVVRNADGKFAAKATETEETQKPEDAKVVDLKTGKPADVAKAEAPADEDDDPEFELPPEKEGAEPKRVKLSQMYEGYEKAAKLEAEIEQVRSQAKAVPAEYQTQLQETVQTRTKYIETLGKLEKMISPRQPPITMLNPHHPAYDPDAYYAAMQRYESDTGALAAIKADQQRLTEQQKQEQEILAKARTARELEAMARVWPEFTKDDSIRSKAAQALTEYGFSKDDIEGITDHRQLAVLKDALELRALKAKSADAAKVVRAKPKLVKGAARSTTNPNESARSNAMNTLRETGSMAAAAAALKGLI